MCVCVSEEEKHLEEFYPLCLTAIPQAGYKGKVEIGMDVAASEFWNAEKQRYDLGMRGEREREERREGKEEKGNDLSMFGERERRKR